ncbi:MAG: methylenetetrahydrofolate reductase [Desulfobacteria bacterium]
MSAQVTGLQERIASGKTILLAEIRPPRSADPAGLRTAAKRYAGKVHAVGVSDNRDRVAMSALAAASLLMAEGVEPILHVTTRDRNRIALVSEALGAQALGIRNLLCTSGTHQTLGRYRAARNVYDIDAVQLLQAYAGLANDCDLLGESGLEGVGPFCLGAVASPDAGPPDLQLARLSKKTRAGAKFLVTHPVHDLERFEAWWKEVARRGLNEQVAILAGIQPLLDDPVARRDAAIDMAVETIHRLSNLPGIRGFCISADGDHEAVLRIVEESGLAGD